jgi:hypothetical protein
MSEEAIFISQTKLARRWRHDRAHDSTQAQNARLSQA